MPDRLPPPFQPPDRPEPLDYAPGRKRWPLWARLLIIVPLTLVGLLLLAFGACLVMLKGV